MKRTAKSILVLGIGNILRKDDGVGIHAVRHILDSGMNIPDNVEIVDGGTGGYDLLPLMMNRERIIIVDAMKYDDAPGSVYRFASRFLRRGRVVHLVPSFSIRSLIDQLSLLGHDPAVEIIGIVPEDIDSYEIGMSNALHSSFARVIDEIMSAVIGH